MKKLSCILLAVMLITAMFVSCKAEVIDDSNLVNVRFTTDDNAKGLNWSRPAFDSSNYYWTYYAKKVGGGPATGEGSGAIGTDLTKEIGPFSQGAWEFTLYGYAKTEDGKKTDVLVYEGTGSGVLSKEKENSVKVAVEARKEGKGIIHVSKDIVLKDSNGVSYSPTGIIVKQVGSDADTEIIFDVTNGNDIEKDSGYYAVTIRMVTDVNGEKIVYASNTIYVNVYDGQTTTIGGTLDEATTSTKFEAEDGTVSSNVEGEVKEDGSASFTVDVAPSTGSTTVEFPKGSLEGEKATLKVIAYPASVSKSFSINPSNRAVVSGIDLTLTVDGANVDTFNGKVKVMTYIEKNLPSDIGVIYNGSEAEDMQPTDVSYNPTTGELVFYTTHFSQYLVTSKNAVVATNEGKGYASLQYAIDDAKDGDTIQLEKNVECDKEISISKALTLNLNGKIITNTVDIWDDKSSPSVVSLILIDAGDGEVRFVGDGKVIAKANDCYAIDLESGRLIIEGGDYKGNVSAIQVETGILEILGGSFSLSQIWPISGDASGCAYTINCIDANYKDGSAVVSIKGGVFKNFNPQDCWAEGENTNFIPKDGGYAATYDASNDVFVVEKFEEVNVNDYDSLVNALNSGKLAVLQDDISLSDSVMVNGGVKAALNLNGKKISMSEDKRAFVVDSANLTVIGEGSIQAIGNVFRVINNGVLSISAMGDLTSTKGSAIAAGDEDEAVSGGTVIVVSAKVIAQEAALLVLKDSKLVVYGGTFSASDNFVVGTNGTSGLGGYDIMIYGGTFTGGIQSKGYIACGVYACNNGKVSLKGGTFNITDGVGVVARSGVVDVGKDVEINLTSTGKLTSGKVGDSIIKINVNSQIVRDEKSDYPAGSPSLNNNSSYKTVGVDGNEIKN